MRLSSNMNSSFLSKPIEKHVQKTFFSIYGRQYSFSLISIRLPQKTTLVSLQLIPLLTPGYPQFILRKLLVQYFLISKRHLIQSIITFFLVSLLYILKMMIHYCSSNHICLIDINMFQSIAKYHLSVTYTVEFPRDLFQDHSFFVSILMTFRLAYLINLSDVIFLLMTQTYILKVNQ